LDQVVFDKDMLDTAIYYFNERERIRQKKEEGEKWPWTKDPILQQFSFTNILREHDRTSSWANQNWYAPHYEADPAVQLFNCGVFRYFGTIEFAEDLGWQDKFDPDYIIGTADERMKYKKKVFTGAYVITNQGIARPKQEVVTEIFLKGLWESRHAILSAYNRSHKWEDAARVLMGVAGFGGSGFMAKEVLQDAMFTAAMPRNEVIDRMSWSPVGPGAQRGLNRLQARPLDQRVREADGIRQMKHLQSWLVDAAEPHMSIVLDRFDLHAVQFICCEIDKYVRVRNGEGRPRQTYRQGRHA